MSHIRKLPFGAFFYITRTKKSEKCMLVGIAIIKSVGSNPGHDKIPEQD